MKSTPFIALVALLASSCSDNGEPAANAEESTPAAEVLFDGSSLDAFDFAEGAWEIDGEGALTCNMEEVKTKSGETKLKGRATSGQRSNTVTLNCLSPTSYPREPTAECSIAAERKIR